MRRPSWIAAALMGLLWLSLPAGGLRPPWAGGLAAALNPTSGRYPHILAVILHKNGDRAGARSLVRKAVELEPNYFAARFFLAELLPEENLGAEARVELAEAARRRDLIRGLSTHSADDARIVEFDERRYERLKRRLSP